MSGYSLLSASAVIVCCFIACHVEPDGFTQAGAGGSTPAAGGAQAAPSHAGSGGKTEVAGSRGAVWQTAAGDDGEAGSGGDCMVTRAGSASGGTSSGGAAQAPPDEIPADAGAGATDCTNQRATCAVLSQPACEFMAFAGATKTLSCGETVAVGTTACGLLCGMVTVELFFDGRYCWQGVPECVLPELAGKFLYPHLP
jgi:hypothetical protein